MRAIFLLLLCSILCAQPILVDGRFDDWENIEKLTFDPAGDGVSGVDFLAISASSDSTRLFLFLEIAEELGLSKSNKISLYIDGDNDASTGLPIGGIGAELVWEFGDKQGAIFPDNDSTRITHSDIGLITLPTLSSTKFEIAINRADVPTNSDSPMSLKSFRFLFRDEQSPDGDQLPDGDGGILLELPELTGTPWVTRPIGRFSDRDIRIVSQNTLHDGILNAERAPAHSRIQQALKPDIVAFQEMWKSTNQSTINYLDSILPQPDGKHWYSTEMEGHVVTASRFPIIGNWSLWGRRGSRIMAVLVQIDASHQILVMNSHWSCCGADENRQLQADTTIAFLRDAYSAGGQIDLLPNTPVVIMGDLNLVGDSQQLTTLLSGDIQNQDEFGEDFAPDWDGTTLTDLYPIHTSERVAYSWQNNGEGYSPGRLDYFVYTDHVTQVKNNFILNTRSMTNEQLEAHGLLRSDSKLASDHLALVADFDIYTVPDTELMKTKDEESSGGFKHFMESLKKLLGFRK
ncbi:endonuclease/exonuclease/phosphatase family protein [bacterium]|nr:endonuclease/exonuclease/phosphatase family protein [bacterium]